MINLCIGMLFFLMVGHALADFSLQSDFLAQAKNRNTALGREYWLHALPAHGLIHGGFVAVITGFWWLGIAETIIHCAVDFLKCEKRINHNTDQLLHVACKFLWTFTAVVVYKSEGILWIIK